MKTLILDNYDSFTFNLYQYVAELGGRPVVHRNDGITSKEVGKLEITHIILSPGPGNPDTPRDIGVSRELIAYAAEHHVPLLGVCLGHQTIAVHFGGEVSRAPEICHGKSSKVSLSNSRSRIFAGFPQTLEVMRYHSLCAEEPLAADLMVTARSDSGVVMGLEHKTLPIFGIQFHPESIGTPSGKDILRNFLSIQ